MSRRKLKITEDKLQLPLMHFIPSTLSAPVTTDNTDLSTLGQLGHSDLSELEITERERDYWRQSGTLVRSRVSR